MKPQVQDDKLLLRLPSSLTKATDQMLQEQLPSLTRSEFIRRAMRFTLDNFDQFKASESSKVVETQPVESVEKINGVRDLWEEIYKYSETVLNDPSAPMTEKRLTFLNRLTAKMIFRMND